MNSHVKRLVYGTPTLMAALLFALGIISIATSDPSIFAAGASMTVVTLAAYTVGGLIEELTL